MSREDKLAKNTLILAIGALFPRIASFLTLPLLTKYLTLDEYGTYDLVLTLVSLVLPACTLQIQYAAFRFLIDAKNKDEETAEIITNIYAFIIPVSLVVLSVVFLWLHNQNFLLRVFVLLYFFLDMISSANKQMVRGLSRNREYTVAACISAFGQIICMVLFIVVLKGGLVGGIIALCIAEFFAILYLMVAAKLYKFIHVKNVHMPKLKEMLAFSWPMVPNTLSSWVMHVSDRLIITIFIGASANAVYAVAYKIPSILTIAYSTFNMAWQENASIVSNDSDAEAYYSKMFRSFFNIVAGAMAFLIGCTPLIFKILVHGDYEQALSQIPILYIGIFCFCLSAFWGGLYVAFKETKSIATTTCLAAACNLVIDLLCIKSIGLYAASLSTLVSYILLCIFRGINIQKYTHIVYNFKQIIAVMMVLVLQCLLGIPQTAMSRLLNFVVGVFMILILYKDFYPAIIRKMREHVVGKV